MNWIAGDLVVEVIAAVKERQGSLRGQGLFPVTFLCTETTRHHPTILPKLFGNSCLCKSNCQHINIENYQKDKSNELVTSFGILFRGWQQILCRNLETLPGGPGQFKNCCFIAFQGFINFFFLRLSTPYSHLKTNLGLHLIRTM